MLYLRAAAVWLSILLLAVLNGGFREAVLFPRFGNPAAQLVSGMLLIGCIVVVSYLLVPRLHAQSRRQLAGIGVLWLVLTLVFEFGFGIMQSKAWPELLAAYTFQGGNIWPIVLLVTLVAPLLVGHRSPTRS
jgi:hypothetical protein